eukprot:scaffold9933_cov44-Phaeocystis_antarctica.AAC.1
MGGFGLSLSVQCRNVARSADARLAAPLSLEDWRQQHARSEVDRRPGDDGDHEHAHADQGEDDSDRRGRQQRELRDQPREENVDQQQQPL